MDNPYPDELQVLYRLAVRFNPLSHSTEKPSLESDRWTPVGNVIYLPTRDYLVWNMVDRQRLTPTTSVDPYFGEGFDGWRVFPSGMVFREITDVDAQRWGKTLPEVKAELSFLYDHWPEDADEWRMYRDAFLRETKSPRSRPPSR